MWGDTHDIHRDTKCVYQTKSSCGQFKLKKIHLFQIKYFQLYNRTPLLRIKVKNENKDHQDELIHVEDLLVCNPLTDLS